MNLHRAYFWSEGDRVSLLLPWWSSFWNFLHCLVAMMPAMPKAYWSGNRFVGISAFSIIDISFRRWLVSLEVFLVAFLPFPTSLSTFTIKSPKFCSFNFVCLCFDCFDNKKFEFGNNRVWIRWSWKSQMKHPRFSFLKNAKQAYNEKPAKSHKNSY